MFAPLLVVSVLLALPSSALASFWSELLHPRTQYVPFPEQPGLVPMDVGLALTDGVVAAWGDFNNDYKVDAVTVVGQPPQNRSIEVRLFDAATFRYAAEASLTLPHVGDVASVALADFNVDGRLDLLALLRRDAGYEVRVYLRAADTLAFGAPHVLPELVGSHVTLLDANFDMRPDLLALAAANASAPTTSVWLNAAPPAGEPGAFGGFVRRALAGARALSGAHSPLYADVDGDCAADLLLPTGEGAAGGRRCAAPNVCYQLFAAAGGALALAPGEPLHLADAFDGTLADVNGDGSLDLVYPSQPFGTDRASLVVLYNARLADANASALCAPHAVPFAACAASNATAGCRSETPLEHAFAQALPSDPLEVSATVHIGDADRDGFPDVLVTLEKEGTRIVQLLNNSFGAAATADAPEQRDFVPMKAPSLEALRGVLSASFVDLGNKGSLDILINHADANNVSSATIFNNAPRAHYFVSVSGTNGVCREWCDSPSPRFVTPEPVGSSLAGSTFRIGHAAYNGDRRRRTASPLVRSAFGALELPYEIVGLGIADNQLDQFVFAPPYFIEDGSETKTLVIAHRLFDQGIFPRATVIAWPTPLDSPALWSVEQQLRFGGATFWTAVTTASMTAVLAVVIAYYVYKEKVEDEVDRRRSAQIFSVF